MQIEISVKNANYVKRKMKTNDNEFLNLLCITISLINSNKCDIKNINYYLTVRNKWYKKLLKKMNLFYFKALYVHDLPWTYRQIGSKWVYILMNQQTWQPYHEIINIKFAIHAIFTKTHISPTVPRVQRVSKLLAFFQNATPSLSLSVSHSRHTLLPLFHS